MDSNEEELFLCEIEDGQLAWFVASDLPQEMLEDFKGSKPPEDAEPTCNTSKDTQYKCNLKSRTRGLQIACTNCGVMLGFREMFCSESSNQVAMLYLDLMEANEGIYYR